MKKILLVEDDSFLSSLLKNRLQKEGFDIVLAKDGDEAVNYLKNTNPDLLLLDLILPKKTGFEVMEEIRSNPQLQKNSSLPIIVISNLGQQEDIAKSRQLGAIEYYIKAKVSIDELVGKIKEFFV
ncbi:MAG: response regulator [Patescibacteria group bacterium]